MKCVTVCLDCNSKAPVMYDPTSEHIHSPYSIEPCVYIMSNKWLGTKQIMS